MRFLSPECLWPWVREPPAALPGLVPVWKERGEVVSSVPACCRRILTFPWSLERVGERRDTLEGSNFKTRPLTWKQPHTKHRSGRTSLAFQNLMPRSRRRTCSLDVAFLRRFLCAFTVMNRDVQYMPGVTVCSCLGLTLVDGCFLNYRNEVERKAVAIQEGETVVSFGLLQLSSLLRFCILAAFILISKLVSGQILIFFFLSFLHHTVTYPW